MKNTKKIVSSLLCVLLAFTLTLCFFGCNKIVKEGLWENATYRKDKTFVSYDNLGSMEVFKNSGRYDIVTDGAAVIRGMYDFGRGDWEHRYYVRNLTRDSMVWVATDDESISQVYVRAELPEELKK